MARILPLGRGHRDCFSGAFTLVLVIVASYAPRYMRLPGLAQFSAFPPSGLGFRFLESAKPVSFFPVLARYCYLEKKKNNTPPTFCGFQEQVKLDAAILCAAGSKRSAGLPRPPPIPSPPSGALSYPDLLNPRVLFHLVMYLSIYLPSQLIFFLSFKHFIDLKRRGTES